LTNYDTIIRKANQFNINILKNRAFLTHIINKEVNIKNIELIDTLMDTFVSIEKDSELSNELDIK